MEEVEVRSHVWLKCGFFVAIARRVDRLRLADKRVATRARSDARKADDELEIRKTSQIIFAPTQRIHLNYINMANYLASIFGTEQDKVRILYPLQTRARPTTNKLPHRSTALSTTKLAPAAMETAARANMSSPHTRKPSSYPTSTKTPHTILRAT
jgi:hypothetical protein